MSNNTTGDLNTASGAFALFSNTTARNTAAGYSSLFSNTTGIQNTAYGANALFNNISGSSNIALGFSAGANLTTGNNNIDIGNLGVAGEANTIRIGTAGTQTAVYIAGITGVSVTNSNPVVIDANGQLGTIPLASLQGPAARRVRQAQREQLEPGVQQVRQAQPERPEQQD